MANVLNPLIPTMFEGLGRVQREMVGMIPAVSRDSQAERAGINVTVRSPIGSAGAAEDIVPGVEPADTGDSTPDYVDVKITKSRAVPIKWNGEEVLTIGPTGQYNKILADQFEDAFRKLTNEIEADLALEGANNASRAYGTAGTAPFGTAADLSDVAGVLQILEDNGTPKGDLQLALNSAAMFNLRGKQSVLFKVNEAGSSDMLRNGMTDRLQGLALRQSAGFRRHTKGTGANYVLNGAVAVGAGSIVLKTGTGTVTVGDIVVFADDPTNKYVVKTGIAAPGTISIYDPKLLAALADGSAVAVGNSYTPNLAFARNAIVLATRAPGLPPQGDKAIDRTQITDPFSGLMFEVAVYPGYKQIKIEVAIAWGVRAIQSRYIASLLG